MHLLPLTEHHCGHGRRVHPHGLMQEPRVKPMQFYADSQLGSTQSTTPECYLVCRDTIIARCGQQLYAED